MLRRIYSFSSLLFRQLFLMLFTRVVVFSPVQNIVGPPSAAAVQQTQGSESDRGGVPVLYRCLPGMAAMNGGSELTAKSPSGWPLHPKKPPQEQSRDHSGALSPQARRHPLRRR